MLGRDMYAPLDCSLYNIVLAMPYRYVIIMIFILLKYGGSGMVDLLQPVIWREEIVPPQWREGLIVNLFKKGDKEDPGNYRGLTLLSVVGKVFCKILNDRLVQHLDEGQALHEGQAGFRKKRSCIDNV